MRFLRVSPSYTPAVNLVATKVRGEPVYEAVKPIGPDTELLVYYLPERPEELFFVRMRASLYRQTMDSILEGEPFIPCIQTPLVTLQAFVKRLLFYCYYYYYYTVDEVRR